MKPAVFSYHDPFTVEEVVSLLSAHEDAKVLAGGQSLMPMLNMRFVQPATVIDLNGVEGLSGISEGPGGIEIGAMTRQRDLSRSSLLRDRMPVFGEALQWVGHFQTRNRGTLGGSLCHLDPAAELPLVACLYDATVTVRGPEGERSVPFAEWPLAYMLPSIAPEEVAVSVRFPVFAGRHGHAFVEYARRHGDFAIVAIGCLVGLGPDGAIESARIAVGGAEDVVRRASGAEAVLAGARPGPEAWRAAAEAAADEIDPMDDAYVSAAYRSRLVRVLTERALTTAAGRAAD